MVMVVSQYEVRSSIAGAAHLIVRSHGFAKVSQQVVGVAQVAVGPTLSGAIAELLHDGQVRPGDDGQELDTVALQTILWDSHDTLHLLLIYNGKIEFE